MARSRRLVLDSLQVIENQRLYKSLGGKGLPLPPPKTRASWAQQPGWPPRSFCWRIWRPTRAAKRGGR